MTFVVTESGKKVLIDMRMIDKSKKGNIKCEHCGHFAEPYGNPYEDCKCMLNGQPRHYWNRCKRFVWREDRQYVGEQKEGAD